MAGQFVTEVNDANFEKDVLQSESPSGRFLGSLVRSLSRARAGRRRSRNHYHGKLKVMKMDVDANTATPMRYGIRGIPALLIFKGGKVAEQIVGFVPKDTIDKSVIKVLA